MATWGTYFQLGLKPTPNTPVAWAVLAIKAELVFNGIPQGGMEMNNPEFGIGTDKKVKEYQKQAGLDIDGVVGPKTAHELFKKRITQVEQTLGIEPHLLCKLKVLESADDPACISENPNSVDRGPMQINSVSQSQVSDHDCFYPPVCFVWSGTYLKSAYNGVTTASGAKDWDLALASYNVGWAGARYWDRLGRPVTNPDGSPNVAARYVRLVRGRTC